MGKVVEIDCEKSMKLETSRNVTMSKRSLHWCRSISKKYLCTFYYSISQKVITLSGRRFITVSGGFITLSGSYYSIGRFYYIIGQLLQYRGFITLSVGTPLLILIYVNDLAMASAKFTPIMYADDTTLLSTLDDFNGNQITNPNSIQINAEVTMIVDWLTVNKLSL